jgi:hypothetical protein
MYRALWHVLPGPTWLKLIQVLILIVGALAALHFWGFPWLQEWLGLDEVQVEGAAAWGR